MFTITYIFFGLSNLASFETINPIITLENTIKAHFFYGTTIIDDNQIYSSIGCMKLVASNLLISCLTIIAYLDLIYTWHDVMVVGCIQFNGVELIMVECPSNICTSKQRHPCTLIAIPPTPAPSLILNLNLPSHLQFYLSPHIQIC
jgi:hypothetical protein